MPVRNQNWYNLQSTRRYPLDDKTTGDSDSGQPIRDDIIVDCHIRYPSTIGKYLFVQGINVTPNLVSIIFGVADDFLTSNCPTVAAVTVEKPAAQNVNYSVTPFVAGLSGWVTLGPGIENDFVGRYSTPIQTFIGFRNARPYTPLPVPSLGKNTVAEYLQGIVNITAEAPIVATYYDAYTLPKFDPETETKNTAPVKAIVFSTTAPTAQFNPQTTFLPPCSQRPESGTCNKQPIEQISGVSPDCVTGNINIIFGDGLQGKPFEECGGIDILTNLGLSQACSKTPPSEKRRNDACPCDRDDGISEYCWPTITDEGEQEACDDIFVGGCEALPVCVSFKTCEECDTEEIITVTEMTVISGSFIGTSTVAPPICCPAEPGLSNHPVWTTANAVGMNVALLKTCAGDWAYDKTVSTELKIRSSGTKQNGGVVLNYVRLIENGQCKRRYFAVMLDAAARELQLYKFDGTLLIKENAMPISYNPGDWYRVSAVAAGSNGTATITGTLYNMSNDTQVATLATFVNDYEVINGRSGIITNSAITYFNKFEIV